MNTEDKKRYFGLSIFLLGASIADFGMIYARWCTDFITFGLIFLVYIIPFLFLVMAGVIATMYSVRKRQNWREKILLVWASLILLAPIVSVTSSIYLSRQARHYYSLSEGEIFTVWGNKVIFENYTSIFPPQTNYIQVPDKGACNWGFAIDTLGQLIIESYTPEKVIVNSPKYPVCDICKSGSLLEKHPYEELKAAYGYMYLPDGISSCGYVSLTLLTPDSVTHFVWHFGFEDHQLGTTYTIPRDSFLLSLQK